jgi:Tfp pilus assembly PilM family ATPase
MALLSFLKRPLVGLDLGVSSIKAVELSPGKSPRLMAYNRIANDGGRRTRAGSA